MFSKKYCLALLVGAACCHGFQSTRAEFLFNKFLDPTGSFNTQYSAWDVFYTPYGSPNYPDLAAPYGTYQTASAAGFTPPANSNPTNPQAYWDTRNATLTQTGTSSAFIIGPGIAQAGNIYSFAEATAYQLSNTSVAGFGNVIFQFQSDGTLIDFGTIRLQYTNAGGTPVSLAPTESIREYRTSGSAFGGLTNRNSLQWNLTGLGVTSYKLVFNALGSSNSFQQAALDTAATYNALVPAARTWTLSGAGNWNAGGNWQGGGTSVENGNVRFANGGAATITLDGSHTVGELQFNGADVAINSPGGYTLTANTGITTPVTSTGLYAIGGNYALNAFNRFDVSGGEVRLGGTVSGNYGFEKDGNAVLTLSGNNTFTGAVSVGAGTLRLSGSNSYSGATSVVNGSLVVGANSALGTATTNVALGADSTLFTFDTTPSAALVLDGNRTLNRNVALAPGTYEKRFVAVNAPTAATFSGNVTWGSTSDNVKLTATTATDRLICSGAMSGGPTSANLTVNGLGTVVYSGAAKSYAGTTNVNTGALQVTSGTSFTGAGAVNVASGAILRVDGAMTRTGSVSVSGTYQQGATGSSAFNGGLTVNNGGVVSAVGGTLTLGGAVINNGTIRLTGGATLAASGTTSFVNNGVVDLLDGVAQLPANFSNGGSGVVLTQNSVRFASVGKTAAGITLTINSLPGFSYQLQRSPGLGAGTNYVNVGAAQTGGNGTTLTFTDSAPTGTQAFYRVVLSR